MRWKFTLIELWLGRYCLLIMSFWFLLWMILITISSSRLGQFHRWISFNLSINGNKWWLKLFLKAFIYFYYCCLLQYVVVKFLGARKESAERIGVLGVNFFGYEVKPDCPLSDELNLVMWISLLNLLLMFDNKISGKNNRSPS